MSPSRTIRFSRTLLLPWLLLCLLMTSAGRYTACAQGALQATLTPLHTLSAVHELHPDAAARHLPVDVVATVSFYNHGTRSLFLQDATGGLFVRTDRGYPLERGDRVEVEGFTSRSLYPVIDREPRITVLSHHAPLQAARLGDSAYSEIMAGRWDCLFVTLRADVRSAMVEARGETTVLELELMTPGGLVQAYVSDYTGLDLDHLLGARVEISGVVGSSFNGKWQMMRGVVQATDARDIRVLHAPVQDAQHLPLTGVDAVMQSRNILDRSRRLRVRGAVTYYRPAHSVVIEQNGKSLSATTRSTQPVALGAIVDLVGFADQEDYGPSLSQTSILLTGAHRKVKATAVTYAEAVSGWFVDDVVTVRGRILSQVHTDRSDVLSLSVDQHPVTVELQDPQRVGSLPVLPVGTMVGITGICRVTASSVWGEPGVTPMLFQIDMRSPRDLQVLAKPTWWTVANLFRVLAGFFLASLGVAVWAIALRRRVAQQNGRIQRTVALEKERSRLLEAITSQAQLEDLLHDICRFVEAYAPGLRCCCILSPTSGEADVAHRPLTVGQLPAPVLFRRTLEAPDGSPIGLFSVGGAGESEALNEFEHEVTSIGAALIVLAVSQRRLYHELNYTSSHDGLTGLPNRRTADARLDLALEDAMRSGGRVGVAYIDIDRFKQVNDQYGHKTGDLYLQQIASRLHALVLPSHCLARIGGDEFLVVMPGLREAELDEVRSLLATSFEQEFVLEDVRLRGAASVGIASFPGDGDTAEALKRHADAAMYAAKQRHKQQPNPVPGAPEGVLTVADLERALAAGHFRLHYQPQFSPEGKLCGLEALLRLQDPQLGMVAPDEFIGVAESSAFIHRLGDWVLSQALEDAERWHLCATPGLRMVLNVAPRQVEQPNFAARVLETLAAKHLPPSLLELEITERTMVRDLHQAGVQLRTLHAAGVNIAIDDFGVEHSCLNSLHLLPVDTLKIDRSFIKAMKEEPAVRPIVRAIVSIAQTMQKRIVAEGVETQQDVDALLSMGEMDLQGYFLGRPQSAADIEGQIATWARGIDVRSEALHGVS